MLMVTVSANAWKFTSVTPATGEVESISSISVAWEGDGWLYEMGAVQCIVTGPGGASYTFNLSNQSPNEVSGSEASFKTLSDPGTYTLTIPAGAFHYMDANWNPTEANEAQTFTWTIKGSDDQGGGTQGGGTQGGGGSQTTGWSFTSVTPAAGTTVESLKSFTFGLPSGINWLNSGGTGTLALPNGETKSVSIYDNFSSINGDILVDNPLTDAGTYTLTIPANAIEGSDGTKNAEMTFSWTIAASVPTLSGVSYDKSSGAVVLTYPVGTVLAATDIMGSIPMQIIGYSGTPYTMVNYEANNEIVSYVNLAAGDYTVVIAAGQFTINGTPNEAISETFTVGGGTQGGGGQQFDGDPFHETIFKAGEGVPAIPFVVNNDNVSISTEGRPFLDTTIDVGYNLYDTKELNWKNGTKFVITAKKDINKVIFVPTADSQKAIAYASATGGNGEYNNGVWEGKLAAGEKLTLTADDGINIKEFYICYNGDDFDPAAGGADEKGTITIQYPTLNQIIAKVSDNSKFCTFTTNKQYAQVTMEVYNVTDPESDAIYKFPIQYFDNPVVGENTKYVATPSGTTSGKGEDVFFFKGDSYKIVVKGFVNMWDVMPDNYDAIAEVYFVGNGIEHEKKSDANLLSITPNDGAQVAMVNGLVTLEFDKPVAKVNALTPGGQFDPTINYTATAKAGSDNKVWEINLGDRSDYASADTDGNPILEVDITAVDAEGGVVFFSTDRVDHALVVKYVLVAGAGPAPVVTIGDPTWSVAEGAEIEASTSSINIKFPQVENVMGTYTFEVSGTIADKQMNFSIVNGTGTVASGADINVTLAEDVAYNLQIGTITIKDGETVIYSTEQANYQLNFATKAAQGGNDGEIEVTGDKNGATFTFVNESDVALSWNEPVTVNGTASDRFDLGMEWNEIVFSPAQPLEDGKYDVVFTAGSLMFDSQNENATDIKVTFYVVDGNITMTAPEPQLPTSVIIYEEGVDTHTNNTELNFSKYDVTLTSETTGSTYVQNNFKPACSSNTSNHLRLFSYNTLKFAAERDIVKIEFVPVSQSAKWGANSVSTGSFADNVWTGKSKTVDLVLNGTNMDVLKIIVTLAGDPEPEKVKATMSIGAAKWGTFVAPFEVTIPAGVTAYKVTGRNEGVLDLEEVATTIPANTPVVVYSESQVAEDFEDVAVDGTPEAGMLVGVYDEAQVEVGTYVLQNHDGVVGFYKVGPNSNKAVKANRCYLVDSSNARAAYFFTEEDATAINGINADVLGAEGIYNASGVRVNSLQKGLNIIKTANGTKKVMIK